MSASPSRWAWLAVLAVGPLVLLGGHLVRGDRLLPYMPVGLEPLAHENPELAERAFDAANFVLGDRIFPIMSDQIAVRGELTEGYLPLWESDVNLGAPLFAGTLVGPAYPPNWLAILFAPDRAGVYQGLITFFLAGLGMALFLGRLGLSPGARVIGVVAYALGGWAVTHVFYFMKVDAAVWLPFMLWAVEGLARRKPWSGFCLSASISLSLLTGFPTISFFVLSLVGPWTLLRLGWPRLTGPVAPRVNPALAPSAPLPVARWKSLSGAMLFIGLGVVGGSLQVAPMFEASRESRRQDKEFDTIVSEAMPPATLLGTILPDLIGAPTETTEPGKLPTAWWLTPASRAQQAANANPAEWNSFVGLVVVLLALVALVASPRQAWFPMAALVITYGFAQAWPLVRWSYHLPFYNIGAPQRVLSVAWFLWPWLAALGVQALWERAPRANQTFFLASFLCAASAFFVWSGFEPATWASDLEATLVERYPNESLESIRDHVAPDTALAAGGRLQRSISHTFAAALAAFVAALVGLITRRGESTLRGLDSPWLFGSTCLLVIVLAVVPPTAAGGMAETLPGILAGAALIGIFAILTRSWREAAWLPIALAVLCEGGLAARGHLGAFPESAGECFPPSGALERVAETVGDGRLLRVDTSPSGTAEVFRLARPNLPQVYGVADMSTYSIFTAQSFVDLCIAIDPRMEFRGSGVASLPDPALLDHPLLDLMRVTCILSVRPLRHPRLEEVVGRDGYYVYRRTGCPPRIRIVPSARRLDSDEAGIELHSSGEVDLAQTTLLAPETAPDQAGEVDARPYRPGQVERVERPYKSALDIEVWGSSGGFLVLHEQYYPGWKATVNGKDTPVLRTDHALRAVRIPRGDSRVELRYRPTSVSAGLGASLIALGLAAVMSYQARRRGFGSGA